MASSLFRNQKTMRNEEKPPRRTRRSFLKKSAMAGMGAQSTLIFSGLVMTSSAVGSGACTGITYSGGYYDATDPKWTSEKCQHSQSLGWICKGSCTSSGGTFFTNLTLTCTDSKASNATC